MARVIISAIVRQKIDDLIEILYKENYFSYIENAIAYADEIVDFMYTIPEQKRRLVINPTKGRWYCQYKRSRRTFWFVLFDTDGETFFIQDVFNNHVADYPKYL